MLFYNIFYLAVEVHKHFTFAFFNSPEDTDELLELDQMTYTEDGKEYKYNNFYFLIIIQLIDLIYSDLH